MNEYQPHQINDDEWIILAQNDHFTGGPNVYRSRQACEAAIQRLQSASPAVIHAAMAVVGAWERGDLATAVRRLDQALAHAWRLS